LSEHWFLSIAHARRVIEPWWNSLNFPDTLNDAKLAAGGVEWDAGNGGSSPRSSSGKRSRRWSNQGDSSRRWRVSWTLIARCSSAG
jgi:hypothetical protein